MSHFIHVTQNNTSSNGNDPNNIKLRTRTLIVPLEANTAGRFEAKFNPYIRKRLTWQEQVRHYFSEYCLSSGIHGVKYLTELGRFFIERIFWIVSLLVMVYFCVSLISKAYNKWQSSPVTITYAATETAIWEVPFPAVTICPTIKSKTEMFNYGTVLLKKFYGGDVTEEENEIFESLSLICPAFDYMPDSSKKLLNLSSCPNDNADVTENICSVSPDIVNDGWIVWMGLLYNKTELSKIYTSHGLCYTFNIIDPNELNRDLENYKNDSCPYYHKSKGWSPEDGYIDDNNTEYVPKRTFISGSNGGLQIDLFSDKNNIDWYCSNAEGFQVALHYPGEFPNMDSSFNVAPDQAVSVAIQPKVITVTEKLRDYSPDYRKCFFSNEKYLRYFTSYTQQNCLDECITNFTLKQCNCITFYMPRLNNTPICGLTKMGCVESSRWKFYLSNDDNDCMCLPSCTSIQYQVEISETNWKWREVLTAQSKLTGDKYSEVLNKINSSYLSRLNVYYKEMQFLSLQRHEVYDSTDFFSNTGGLLGLFLGFSLTSAIEIFYFLTLRVIYNVKKYGKRYWSGYNSSSQN